MYAQLYACAVESGNGKPYRSVYSFTISCVFTG